VHVIGVNEPTGNKSVVLVLLGNGGGPENEIIYNFTVPESGYGNCGSNNYYAERNIEHATR
jgi:hypothetical protein